VSEEVFLGKLKGCLACPEGEDKGFFSWQACDLCNSSLGGMRFAAHTREGFHLDVCTDCLEGLA
jgi:hypothetical protein